MSFSDKIKMLRKHFNLSQAQFGQKVNKSVITIQNWEYGKSKPDIDNLKYIAKEFGVNVDWLIGGGVDMFSSAVDNIELVNSRANSEYRNIVESDENVILDNSYDSNGVFNSVPSDDIDALLDISIFVDKALLMASISVDVNKKRALIKKLYEYYRNTESNNAEIENDIRNSIKLLVAIIA